MENNKEIGKAFRSKIEALDKSPSDRLWANIEKDLKVKKRRSPFFWLLPLMLTLGLTVGGFYYFSDGFGKYNLDGNENINGNGNDNSNGFNENYENYDNNSNVNSTTISSNNQADSNEQFSSEEDNSLKSSKDQLSHATAIKNNTEREVVEQEDPIKKTQTATKTKGSLERSKGKSGHSQSAPTSKTLYSRESTRITTTAKRLVKSTPEFDEYEVVKKYTYVVRKKKPIVKTKNKTLGTPLDSEKTGLKKKGSKEKSGVKKSVKPNHTFKNNASSYNAKAKAKGVKKHTKKTNQPLIKSDSAKVFNDKTIEVQDSSSKNEVIATDIEKITPTKDTIRVVKDSLKKKKKKIVIKASKKDSIPVAKTYPCEVFLYGSPTLSSSTSKNSPLDSRLNNSDRSSNLTFSYGGYICYIGNSRVSVRIGFGKSNLNFKTKNVPVNTSNYSNINYTGGFSNAFIYNQSNHSEHMTLIQDISYTEIPLELKYKFIDKKIGVNGILGFEYLFLSNNTISAITSNGNKYAIGNTKNLTDGTFGLNFGFGLDYKITKRIKFNVEPMLKYHVKAYQNKEAGNPFSVNILTGLQFSL